MNRHRLLLTYLMALLSGCGQQLSGRYEGSVEIPSLRMPSIDAKMQGVFDQQMKKVSDMNRMTLEFFGSKVRMGTPGVIAECSYTLKDNHLEIVMEQNGQKIIAPMTVEPDGAITYLSIRYRKVE